MKYEWEKFIVAAREEFKDLGKTNEAFAEKAQEIMRQYGADESVDDDEFVQHIADLDGADAWAHCFEFDYLKKTEEYEEYDGEQVFAPNEEIAWEFFLGMDGEFKIPNAGDYACRKIK